MTEMATKHLGERFAPQLPGGFDQVRLTILQCAAVRCAGMLALTNDDVLLYFGCSTCIRCCYNSQVVVWICELS
jgi:hypothetical protein